MMCYPPSGYIIFSLRKLKFYGGREQDVSARGRITQTPVKKTSCFLWRKSNFMAFMQFWKSVEFLVPCSSLGRADAYRGTRFFYKQRLFSTQPSWIEPQMLFGYCLIHVTIKILKHVLYFVYLCSSRPTSINVVSLWSVFHFQPHFHWH